MVGDVHFPVLGIDVYKRDVSTIPPSLDHVASYSMGRDHQVLATDSEDTIDRLVDCLKEDNSGKPGFDEYFDPKKAKFVLKELFDLE